MEEETKGGEKGERERCRVRKENCDYEKRKEPKEESGGPERHSVEILRPSVTVTSLIGGEDVPGLSVFISI